MGKGTRNRQNREEAVEIVSATPAKKKNTRVRKPLSPKVKSIITYAVTILLLVGALAGILSGMGTFKRANIIVKSESGKYNLNQQMATYIVWSSAYYEYYYNWQYYMTTEEKATFNNALNGGEDLTASQYALYAASNLTQQSLKSAFNSFEASFRGYVAVCDVAEELGISITREELKAAAKEVQEQMESMASSSSMSTKRYLKNAIGNNVKMRDIKKVAKYQALYNKVMETRQTEVEGSVNNEILANFRDKNLDAFYSTDYISYVIKEGEDELKAELLAATSADAFKTILVKNTFDKNYKDVFNKYAIQPESASLVTAIKDALKEKTTAEDWTEAIDSLKAGETPKLEETDVAQSVTKGQEGLASEVSTWIFSADRRAFDTDLITTDDAYYVISLQTKPEGDTASALIKKSTKVTGESFDGNDNFKADLYYTILVALELEEKEEGKTDYSDKNNTTTIGKIKNDLQTSMEKVVPTVTTQAYVAEPKANTYQDWMFDKDSLTAPEDAVAGKVKEFSETTGEGNNAKTTVTIYCIVEAMKYDTDPVVDGGYVTFSTESSHETDAQNYLDSLAGLTGDALKEKFSSNASAAVSDAIYKDYVSTDIADWLFSADRKADDVAKITVDKKSYVAFFSGSVPTWEYEAENGYVNETLSNWIEELSADYEIRGMGMVKDKTVTK